MNTNSLNSPLDRSASLTDPRAKSSAVITVGRTSKPSTNLAWPGVKLATVLDRIVVPGHTINTLRTPAAAR